MIVEVNALNAAAGVGVCAQDSVELVIAACGTQLITMSGAFMPSAAGALIVRFAFAVIAKLAEPAGNVHASATLAVATPAVATLTAAEPVPPVSVTAAGKGLNVGATGVTVAAGQVKPQTRLVPTPEMLRNGGGTPILSLQVKVAVPAVAARVQAKLMLPAAVL